MSERTDGGTRPLVTVSGPPGSGTTTLASRLESELEYEFVSGGDVFRQLAADRGMTLAEFTSLAEEDDEIDRELDARLKDLLRRHRSGERACDGRGLILESRLAGWHADGDATLAVWLDAPADVRVERTDGRTETADELRVRERSEAKRYEEYYGIDISDLSVYDLVVNTATIDEDGMVECVVAAIEGASR